VKLLKCRFLSNSSGIYLSLFVGFDYKSILYYNNSYLCNKLGKVIFFLTRCGIFNRDEVEIKNASSTEKTLFLRIAHMIFSTGVWKIHKIWIFLIYY
jgi:hypothetical protein